MKNEENKEKGLEKRNTHIFNTEYEIILGYTFSWRVASNWLFNVVMIALIGT